MKYCLASSLRITSFGDECVLHNLKNGRWLKIKKRIFELLCRFCEQGIDAIRPFLSQESLSISEFNEFTEGLHSYSFLVAKHSQKSNLRLHLPIAAYLNITERCNLECKTCYFSAKKVVMTKEMSLRECLLVMDKLAEGGVKHLIVAGGEPTIRKDIVKIISNANRRFTSVTLITNGTLMSKRLAQELVGFVDLFQVSLDGPNEVVNSQIRGKGAFVKTTKGIESLKKAGADKILLVCTVTKTNIDSISEMAKLADSLGVEFGSSIFLASGYGACNEHCLSPAWQDLLSDFRNEIFHLVADENKYSEGNSFTTSSNLRIGLSCGAATLLISIGPDGAIYPCHVFHKSEFCIGNLLDGGHLLDILERSPVVKHFRELDVEHKAGCKQCDVRYFCRGGCIAQAFVSSGRLETRDKFCPLFKKVFRAQIWSINDHLSDKEKAKRLLSALKK